MAVDLRSFADAEFCYLTTEGRVSGQPHTIEIWFALSDHVLYMMAGGGTGADWVKNSQHHPQVTVRINDVEFTGQARTVAAGEEDVLARRLVLEKYQRDYDGDLSDWGRTALPVAVELQL